MTRLLPPAPFFRDLVLTSLWFWVGLRVASAIGGGFSGLRSPVVAVPLVLLVGLLAHLDRKSRGLGLLMANLGFSWRRLTLLVLGVAGLAEGAFQLLLWAVA